MRFSLLWPEITQDSPPPSTANAASPIDQPDGWGRARASSESRGGLPESSRFMVGLGRLSIGKVVQHVFDGSSRLLVAHMIQEGQLDDRERRELLELLKPGDGPEADR
jgi:hypothetical protein